MTGLTTVNILGEGELSGMYPVTLGVDATHTASAFVGIYVNASDPNDAPGTATSGWIISTNSSGQTMTVWRNNEPGATPICTQRSTPASSPYVTGFGLCAGVAGTMFPTYLSSTALGEMALNLYQQSLPGMSTGVFASAADGCGLLSVLSPASPYGGALAITLTNGTAGAPPASWAVPPAGCGL